MSNRLFQGIIHQMKDAVDRVIGVLDENGIIISCSDLAKIGGTRQGVRDELSYTSETVMSGGYTYKPIGSGAKTEYIVFVEGEDKQAERLAAILSISLGSIKGLYDDKYDKDSFIKNVILDNILPSDIYLKSKELHFSNDVMRIVMLIKFIGKNEIIPYQMVQNMFPDKNKDYVISVGESDIVLVKEVKPNYDTESYRKDCSVDLPTPSDAEFLYKGIHRYRYRCREHQGSCPLLQGGTGRHRGRKGVRYRKEYRKLRKPRHRQTYISAPDHSLRDVPLTRCSRRAASRHLTGRPCSTIQCFFENNLNVSETSRKLFVHRNTLVYRLEKIRKLTGLDLREFDHAITFKVAMMVKKYLTSKPVKF